MSRLRWRVGSPEVVVQGTTETLTPIEVRLLDRLVASGSEPVPRERLLVDVWEYSPTVQTRAVHHAVTRLRKKLGRGAIETVRGAGYRLGSVWDLQVREASQGLGALEGPARGLEARVQAVRAQLERSGWVVLAGIAGSGRTRLARAVAEGWDDVVWVELAGVEADAMEAAVGRALGLERSGPAVVGRVLAHRGPVLLVLDDVAAPDRLQELAPTWLSGGSTRLVATTAAQVADGAPTAPVPGLEPDAAAALYEDRLAPGLQVDAAAVDRLVRLLDGHPRALVQAAARAALLPPGRLADRIEADPSGTVGPVGAIRSAVAASWELLPADTRDLAATASIFEGRFRVEDLAAVASVDEDRVVEGLHPLLEGGLLLAEDGALRLGRWVRRHASEVLGGAGRRATVAVAHLAWVRRRCREERGRLYGPDHRSAMAALGALRVEALAALARPEASDLAAADVLGSLDPWHAANLGGPEHLGAWDRVDLDALPSEERARAIRHRVHGQIRAGRIDGALEAIVGAEEALDDPGHQAGCRAMRAALTLALGDVGEARTLARPPVGEVPDRARVVLASLRGTTALAAGDLDAAEQGYADALTVARRCGDRAAQGLALGWLGNLAIQRGTLDRAVRWFEEGIRTLEPLGNGEGLASAHGNIGVCLLETGRPEEADARYRQSLEVARSVGSEALACTARLGLALGWLLRDEPVRALTELDGLEPTPEVPVDLAAEIGAFRALAMLRAGTTGLADRELERARELAATATEPSPSQVVAAVGRVLAGDRPGPPPADARAVVRLAHRLGDDPA